MNFLEKKIFSKNKKITLENRIALYGSILFLLLIIIFALKDFVFLYLKNYYLITIILLSIYIFKGAKSKKWFNGIQGLLVLVIILTFFSAISLKDSNYFLSQQQYNNYHSTVISDDLWINLSIKNDNTYEIQLASPNDGKWGNSKKGKISSLTKQRYNDTGQEYYCFYLEDYPFYGERTMVAFEDAFSIVELKYNSSYYTLSNGLKNPWKN